MRDDVVFNTPWFRLLARHAGGEHPYYCIDTFDYVSVVALDEAGQLVLVKQFRPAIGGVAVELPGGHVEPGREPLDAAKQELWEETGYRAATWEPLGCLRPDVGRLTNRLWCFWAAGLSRTADWQPEQGVEVVTWKGTTANLLSSGLDNAFSLASVFLAVMKGKLR
jgi:ADP-ribose pyrophosphatase YjhB (NUDIX family)